VYNVARTDMFKKICIALCSNRSVSHPGWYEAPDGHLPHRIILQASGRIEHVERYSRPCGYRDIGQNQSFVDLAVYAVDCAEPRPRERRRVVQVNGRRFLIGGIFVDRANHHRKFCVVEDGTPFVEHVVNAKLNAAADYPAQGTVVVVYNVVY